MVSTLTVSICVLAVLSPRFRDKLPYLLLNFAHHPGLIFPECTFFLGTDSTMYVHNFNPSHSITNSSTNSANSFSSSLLKYCFGPELVPCVTLSLSLSFSVQQIEECCHKKHSNEGISVFLPFHMLTIIVCLLFL